MPESGSSRVIAVWPCDHGGVIVEPGKARPGYECHRCGATARTYVAVDAHAMDAMVDRAAEFCDRRWNGSRADSAGAARETWRTAMRGALTAALNLEATDA